MDYSTVVDVYEYRTTLAAILVGLFAPIATAQESFEREDVSGFAPDDVELSGPAAHCVARVEMDESRNTYLLSDSLSKE